jgi:hypothetical protein
LTGEFDSATTEAVHSQVNTKRISKVDRSARGLSLVTITNTPSNGHGRYSVNFGPHQEIFATSDPKILSERLNRFMVSSGDNQLYVDFDSFSPDKARALTDNLKRQQRVLNPNLEINGIRRSEIDPDLEELCLQPIKKVEVSAPRIEVKNGVFQAVIDLVIDTGKSIKRISVVIAAATRELATELAELVHSKLLSIASISPDGARLSVAQIVSAAEKDFRTRHPEIKDADYVTRIVGQFGTIDISAVFPKSSARNS